MKTLVLAFLIFGYVQAHENSIDTNIKCTSPGYVCDGIQTSYHCQLNIDGTYTLNKIEDCTKNEATCLKQTGHCIKPGDYTQDDSDYKFKCQQTGMFPDPFDCAKYYICDHDESGNIVTKDYYCPSLSYDIRTGECSIGYLNCPVYVKPCQKLGDTGRVGDMDNMYYVCLPSEGSGVFPQIFLCRDGELFIDGECRVPDDGLDEDGMCREVGLFYTPEGCNRFTKCETVGETPIGMICSCSTMFDPIIGDCVTIPC